MAAPIRLDKWLWHARFFKSRSLAAQAVGTGRMRLNSQPVAKPATMVRPGDVLTFVQGERVRVVRVQAPGQRRGPAPEAQSLYDDLSQPAPPPDPSRPQSRSGGRPSGRDRRVMDAIRGRDPDT
ncbi:MAG: ribosome-associated heat shock protein Hsp15 HslR [Rhodobacteraceae bacterium HLUCCA12]|nr:MAG: ribosome-associated heat shock protein Hsp15 HslR [Rhodobacteraceae bacterium HLUCCA12]